MPAYEDIDPQRQPAAPEPELGEPEDEDALRAQTLHRRLRATARQAAMDPDDGIAL